MSNRDGIGARVSVVTQGKELIREVAAGSSQIGQNMRDLAGHSMPVTVYFKSSKTSRRGHHHRAQVKSASDHRGKNFTVCQAIHRCTVGGIC